MLVPADIDSDDLLQAGKVVSIDAHRARFLSARDALVEAHLNLVHAIATSIKRNLPPSFDLEDLIGAGNLALVRAATRYRPKAHGDTPFAAFARQVIAGAILDTVRRRHYLENTRPDLDQVQPPAVAPVIETVIDRGRLRRRLANEMAYLAPEEQEVLAGLYGSDSNENTTLAELAAERGVKVWKIARIRDTALARLRQRRIA